MSHDIEQARNGMYRMFGVGERWHNLGQGVDRFQAATANEAMDLSLTNWKVVEQKLYNRNPVTGEVLEVIGHKSIWRTGDSPKQLGVVGSGYQIFQNGQMFDSMDSLIGSIGGAHYESAGFLNSGILWVLARIPSLDFTVGKNDITQSYLLGSTRHDGYGSIKYKEVKTRVVCWNTLSMALGESSTTFTVKHTKNAVKRIAEVTAQTNQLIRDSKELEERLNWLVTRKMTRDSATQIFDRLFPVVDSAKTTTRRDNTVTRIMELYDFNNGNMFPEQRGTAYNLLNAITEYTDHERSIRETDVTKGMETSVIRSASALFGSGSEFKTTALDAILQLTQNNPAMPSVSLAGVA